MLKNRIITAAWAIPVLGVIIWFGEPYFTIFIAIVGLLAAIEFYRLSKGAKAQPLTVFGIIWTILLIVVRDTWILSHLTPYLETELLVPNLLTAGMAISLLLLLARKQKQGAFTDWSWTLAEILYVGWLLGYLIALRGLDDGRSWVFFAILATFGSDSAAYFIGRLFGKQKLAPTISPKKTWEGAVGGLAGAVAVSLLFLLPTPLKLTAYLNWWQLIIVGLFISVFGQLGDLVESLFKRNTGVKDSGNIFPGHGGMLDRMDSIVFAAVVVYYVVILLGIL
jgi:phosphatidate cytidylyltransferase